MLRALIHKRINSALSPAALHVSGVTPGSFFAHDVSRTPCGKVCNMNMKKHLAPHVNMVFINPTYMERTSSKSFVKNEEWWHDLFALDTSFACIRMHIVLHHLHNHFAHHVLNHVHIIRIKMSQPFVPNLQNMEAGIEICQ